jgi:hypothetical protein
VLEAVEHGAEAIDADWNESFNARILEVALRRIRPRFELTTWRAFERIWLEGRSAADTAADRAFSWLDAIES